MKPVDIVVTYCNSNDEEWQKNYEYWKTKEIQEGKADKDNQQAFNMCRYRDWGVFKYWFRGVEKNCPWVRNVILVVQNKNHVPKWLDTTNKKLRVVYHEDFIPEEFLPTFSAMTIEMFIPYIEGLSDLYITSDDDFYFLNPTPRSRFFTQNDRVCAHYNETKYGKSKVDGPDGVFGHILNNNLDFEKKHYGEYGLKKYRLYHMPAAKDKQFDLEVLSEYKDELYEAQRPSKFRHPNNVCFPIIMDDLLKITKKALSRNPYQNSKRCIIRENTNFNEYKDSEMVCFNDGEYTPYSKKEDLVLFLQNHFPARSSFEKEDEKEELVCVEATEMYSKRNIRDIQLNRVPKPGERWYVTKERAEILLKGVHGKPCVKIVKGE